MKTRKSVAKRFKFSKPKKANGKKPKISMRTCGQDHFNAREDGKTGRKKRKNHQISKAKHKTIKQCLPYA